MSAFPSLPSDAARTVVAVTGLGMAFATKHFLADFIFQTNWMARGKEQPSGWGPPLLAHALCHAVLTLAITLVTAPRLWWLSLIDLGVHLAIDRSKTLLAQRGGLASRPGPVLVASRVRPIPAPAHQPLAGGGPPAALNAIRTTAPIYAAPRIGVG